MSSEISIYAEKILEAVNVLGEQKKAFAKESNQLKRDNLKQRIDDLVQTIDGASKSIYDAVGGGEVKQVQTFDSKTFRNLTPMEKKRFVKELNIGEEKLERFVKEQKLKKTKKIELKKAEYRIHAPNEWGKLANKHAKKNADSLVAKHPKFFEPLFKSFERVNMPFLTRTYVSLMLFWSVLSIPIAFIVFLILGFAFGYSILFVILLTILAPFITFAGFYFYPSSLQGERERKIRNELPFALVHMSAVAGSGAHPISMFELLVDSKEYPELKKEIRKVLNYVNLFGYNLTTALKNVAQSTPSPELKELFNGLVSTIETGGDLKAYLREKADEALNSYKLLRKKKVDSLATLSEVYTAILIAAPLLLIVALAIMNNVGGDLGGMSISTIAYASIVVVLPLLNVGYMFFVNASQR